MSNEDIKDIRPETVVRCRRRIFHNGIVTGILACLIVQNLLMVLLLVYWERRGATSSGCAVVAGPLAAPRTVTVPVEETTIYGVKVYVPTEDLSVLWGAP